MENLNYLYNRRGFYVSRSNFITLFIYSVFLLLVFFIVVIIFKYNLFSLLSFDMLFSDQNNSFAESLVRLYHIVWTMLIIVLTLVIFLLYKIICFFLRYTSYSKNRIIKNSYRYYLEILLFVNLIIEDFTKIKNSLILILNYVSKIKFLNFWYKNKNKIFNKFEFLIIADIAEYKVLELAWCGMPTIGLMGIMSPSIMLIYGMDASLDTDITIKVISHQWYWNYEYSGKLNVNEDSILYENTDIMKFFNSYVPKLQKNLDYCEPLTFNYIQNFFDQLYYVRATVNYNFNFDSVMIQESYDKFLFLKAKRLLEVDNRLVVPFGVPIKFIITSTDVLHSWSVPSLGIKVDAVPGRLNQFVTEIKNPGVFYGQCSELCGPLHAFMPIVIEAVTPIEFEKFLLKNIS